MGEPGPAPLRSPARVWAGRLGKVVLMALLFVSTGELAVRMLRPAPRLLVVRPTGPRANITTHFGMRDGHPVWKEQGTEERLHPPCAPGLPEVWLVGDSIFFGIKLKPEEAPSAALQRLLDAAGVSACVRNLSQPGYGGAARHRAFQAELSTGAVPAVVVVESWESDPMTLKPIGDAWYALADVHTDATGWPVAPLPVPTGFHHFLFLRSELWWYATLTVQSSHPDAMRRSREVYRTEHFLPMIERAQALGAEVITVVAPRLDRPFGDSVSTVWEPGDDRADLRALAEARGVPVVAIADRLVDQDLVGLRLDLCCHVSAAGAEAYARAMLPEVLAGLRPEAAP